ncbi:unnamed protein product [Clonostachys chloroleuca]|uniref:Nucleoside phosphorylase domain-containing protein n=1 Tax=Clonostachys chloroleuca TaxID=1926264 RepID=A0AA35LYB5_9HYPO|nr:unnamed protein product [Clonostachys chloroleuca]
MSSYETPSSNPSKRQRTNANSHQKSLSYDDYTVGWICALSVEMAAAEAMLDHVHSPLPNKQDDTNAYTFGSIGSHNVVVACLPAGYYGTNNAANVATNMQRSFRHIDKGLLVGVGGGVPDSTDIRLGDVVVSFEVVPYDLGKAMPDGRFFRTSIPRRPAQSLLTAIAKLRASHDRTPSRLPNIMAEMHHRHPHMTRYRRPNLEDKLFATLYSHVKPLHGCENCDSSQILPRRPRETELPEIHYGRVGSGNQIVRDGVTRSQRSKELDVLCFETEAAGVMDIIPCLVVRGICDYSDSHKNKQWQHYSAAVAAAYSKELLLIAQDTDSSKILLAEDSSISADHRNRWLEALSFGYIDSRRRAVKAAHAKTCEWFLKDPRYLAWQDPASFDENHGFLWVIDKWRESADTAVTSFFFNATGEELEKSTTGMYRSLLLQALESFPSLQHILNRLTTFPKTQNSSFLDIEILEKLFNSLVQALGDKTLFCFIDALDECNQEQILKMVESFEALGELASRNKTKLYVCFSSRPYPYIEVERGLRLQLDAQEGHASDLESYVRSKLRAGRGKMAEEIIEDVLSRASGVFMWVVLTVEILNQEIRDGRIFALKRRLHELPSDLSEVFRQILTQDERNIKDMLLCIQWILFSRRPLTTKEFYTAVSFGLNPEPETVVPWDPGQITPEIMARLVSSSSKGLAEITKSQSPTVQFIHESVRDFLIKENGIGEIWPDLREDFESKSHDQLKQSCEAYLKVDISDFLPFTDGLTPMELAFSFPMLEYSTSFILEHAEAASQSIPQGAFLADFSSNEKWPLWINLHNVFDMYGTFPYSSYADLEYVLCERGHTELFRTIFRPDFRKLASGGRYSTSLIASSASGNLEIMKTLLEASLDGLNHQDQEGSTALAVAAKTGQVLMTKALLGASGVTTNIRDKHGKTPLLCAAELGHKGCLRLLLGVNGIDPDSKDNLGQTPLSWAARNGHEECVMLLLAAKGVDPDSRDNNGRTPLSWSVANGQVKCTRRLLIAGASPDLKDNSGWTPLAWATAVEELACVEQLLEADANPNSTDDDGWTPLLWAVANGYAYIFEDAESEQ